MKRIYYVLSLAALIAVGCGGQKQLLKELTKY